MFKTEHAVNKNITPVSIEVEGISRQNDFLRNNGEKQKESSLNIMTQPKASIGAIDEVDEKEVDTVADKVLRMPDNYFIQRKYNTGNNFIIQRQGENDPEKKEDENKANLQKQPAEPDYLKLRTPFLERNVPHLWDPDSALGVWRYNHKFFLNLGVSDNLAGKAANLTAPFAINSQLKAGNPTWWEITDKDLKTTSLVGSVPIFSFDANFKNLKFLPFLQKKSVDTMPPASKQIPGENFIQRNCAHCSGKEQVNHKSSAYSITPFIQSKNY